MSGWRWPFYAVGTALIAFGLWGEAFGADTDVRRWAALVVVAAVAHDLVLVPAVMLVGAVATKVVPRSVRPLLQGAALVALSLLLVAVPLLVHGRP